MSQPLSQPLPVSQKLFSNPRQKPHFAVSLPWEGGSLSLVDPRATRALLAIMDMHAVIGGAASHYGGPAAFAELMSATHALMFARAEKAGKPWHELFHFVNDAGHCENGLYALKANYNVAGVDFNELKKFRSIESRLTGHGESHLFPEGVLLSNGPLGSAFPQSQGLAMADAAAKTQRITVTAISDGACMEGEAREAMAAIPGLAEKALLAPYVLIISDNNTKLTGRIDKESFSMEPTFRSLSALGWDVIDLKEGNDLAACLAAIGEAFQRAEKNPRRPVAVHARTVKGIGTKKTAESSSGGHGFSLKSSAELPAFIEEIYSGSPVPEEFRAWIEELKTREADVKSRSVKPTMPEEKIQVGISAAMIRATKEGLPVVSVTSDLPGSTGVAGFRKEFPAASFDVGVAESNMISTAAGFSKRGYIPVMDTFAQFGVTKGALPLTMASLSEAPVIGVFSHTGFQDAADGASHQALTYLGMTLGIPHLRVVALSCSEEADALMSQALKEFADARRQGKVPPTTLFFLGRENFPKSFGATQYSLDRAQVFKVSEPKACLVAVGSMLQQALNAQKELQAKGIGVTVVHPSTLNRWDSSIGQAINEAQGRVLVIEDHQRIGGYGNLLAAELLENQVKVSAFQILAVRGEFGQSAYTSQDLYAKHGIDTASIVKRCQSLLG